MGTLMRAVSEIDYRLADSQAKLGSIIKFAYKNFGVDHSGFWLALDWFKSSRSTDPAADSLQRGRLLHSPTNLGYEHGLDSWESVGLHRRTSGLQEVDLWFHGQTAANHRADIQT